MDKYIFLDIDGVLAIPDKNHLNNGRWGLHPDKQKLLGKIIDETSANIVLSSTWRCETLKETKKFMKNEGFYFLDKLVGVTIRWYHHLNKVDSGLNINIPRGVEIDTYINQHISRKKDKKGNVKRFYLGEDYNYLILDDDNDMLYNQKDNFIQTDHIHGLIESDVEKAIEILNRYD